MQPPLGKSATVDSATVRLSSAGTIVLATVNARYIHAAFGLRYLYANLGELQSQAKILEFTTDLKALDIAEAILAEKPKIVGLGVYIWNAQITEEIVALLKRIQPDLKVVLGGPEVSYETEEQRICELADYVISGEGELSFLKLCQRLLEGKRPLQRTMLGEAPELEELKLPYTFYNDQDVKSRVIYVEASRGCPFRCEFCLSSLDKSVRPFPLEAFLSEMQSLLDRGVRQFKFVDRTFNLKIETSRKILQFFLDRLTPDLFLHFEMIPDRLPEELRELIRQFPAGSLQFEVGVQSLNDDVNARISRRQNVPKMFDNLGFLGSETGVHVHADLILGLPSESAESFGQGLDRLVAAGPHEIQLGVLKRLRGTPIARHTEEWGMVYADRPPYEILKTNEIDFAEMQRLKRMTQVWGSVVNKGYFVHSAPLLWQGQSSCFSSFLAFSDYIYQTQGRVHSIALNRWTEILLSYLETRPSLDQQSVLDAFRKDFVQPGKKIPPSLKQRGIKELRRREESKELPKAEALEKNSGRSRQERHQERR